MSSSRLNHSPCSVRDWRTKPVIGGCWALGRDHCRTTPAELWLADNDTGGFSLLLLSGGSDAEGIRKTFSQSAGYIPVEKLNYTGGGGWGVELILPRCSTLRMWWESCLWFFWRGCNTQFKEPFLWIGKCKRCFICHIRSGVIFPNAFFGDNNFGYYLAHHFWHTSCWLQVPQFPSR